MFHPHGSLKNKVTWKRKFKILFKKPTFRGWFFFGFFLIKTAKSDMIEKTKKFKE